MAEPYLSRLQQIVAQLEPLSSGSVSLEVKHFFSGAALYANKKICASLSPARFALKLPQNTRQELLAEGKATEFRFFPSGPIKVGYVALSNSVLEDENLLQELIDRSVSYVSDKYSLTHLQKLSSAFRISSIEAHIIKMGNWPEITPTV